MMAISRRHLLSGAGACAARVAVLPGALQLSRANQPGRPIHLDRNENAYGPSEKAITAMREATNLAHRYPDSECDDLTKKIARVHGVAPEQVVLGCGSSEILRVATATFLGPGKKLVVASPTWGPITEFARNTGAEVVSVPLDKKFAHDLNAMLDHTDSSTGLIYICNPNNPTGSLTPREDLVTFISRLPTTACVVVDQAYHHYRLDYSLAPSDVEQSLKSSRVIVTRTFSGIYGLAGLRVGYGIAAPATARQLAAGRLPYGVNQAGVRAAAAALDDTGHVGGCAERNASDRQEFMNQANARMLRAIDSHTNFVMLRTGCPAKEVIERFRKNNIILPSPFPDMDKYVRVSLGRPEEMLEFWRVWDLAPCHKMAM